MRCRYCGAWNHEEESRCVKCQRRIDFEFPRATAERPPVVESAAVPQPAPQVVPQQAVRPKVVAARPEARRPATQPSLFPHRPQEKVMALTGIEPRVERAPQRPSSRRRSAAGQTSFEFEPAGPPRPAITSELSLAHAKVPVAPLSLRAMAAAFDTGLVLAFSGLFLLTLHALSRWVLDAPLFTRATLPYLLVAPLLIGFTYKLMWCLSGRVTLGIQGAGLRLISFEGGEPTQVQRLLRFACGWLSLCCGIGLLWALADQETLTWHDHVSQTFLTPARRP